MRQDYEMQGLRNEDCHAKHRMSPDCRKQYARCQRNTEKGSPAMVTEGRKFFQEMHTASDDELLASVVEAVCGMSAQRRQSGSPVILTEGRKFVQEIQTTSEDELWRLWI